jgi:hypothetical protein
MLAPLTEFYANVLVYKGSRNVFCIDTFFMFLNPSLPKLTAISRAQMFMT